VARPAISTRAAILTGGPASPLAITPRSIISIGMAAMKKAMAAPITSAIDAASGIRSTIDILFTTPCPSVIGKAVRSRKHLRTGYDPAREGNEPPQCAVDPAMLCYVDDGLPGITRRRSGRGWAYFDDQGNRIMDRDEIDRLNRIALPPAYRDAWFCATPEGHVQAIGYDEKGRKQYRYHEDFRAAQDADKYDRCLAFGLALPRIRVRVADDLSGRSLGKDAVVAAIVRLLDLGRVRIGNASYAKANRSFGATTLRNRHAQVRGRKLHLEYLGKSGKIQRLTIEDQRLSRIVRRCQDLPGQNLFQYVDEGGSPRPVTSSDVNAYLREASGDDFTAKHFRTWGASVLAYRALIEAGEDGISLKAMLEPVAQALGNTAAISRKSYVHPALLELAKAGGLRNQADLPRLPRATKYLSSVERGLLAFLETLADERDSTVEAA
jgi:DNA topoisomerase-1